MHYQITEIESALREAMLAHGLDTADTIVADGELHRFHVKSDKSGRKNGWYIIFLDIVPAGQFGCWKRDIKENWCSKNGSRLSKSERTAMTKNIQRAKEEIKRKKRRRQIETCEVANGIWDDAKPAPKSHPYLRRKSIKPYGLRFDGKTLLAALRDPAGKIWSLQRIYPDGSKKYLFGGRIKGCYYTIGTPKDRIYIAEGFATAATIHEATDEAVVVAFSASNLKAVAKSIREKYPGIQIVIVGDDDSKTKGNPGKTEAIEAAREVQGQSVFPHFQGGTDESDFNDLYIAEGQSAVIQQLESALTPSSSREPLAEKRYPRTDLGNAEFFSDMNSSQIRYDHARGDWRIWKGHWWEADGSDEIIQLTKASARKRFILSGDIDDLAERQKEASWAILSESRTRIDSMLKLAKSEPSIAVAKGTQWNSDQMLLGVGNGVVNLRSGRLLPGKQSDLISIHTPVDYTPMAKCPRWRQFISEVLNKDAALIRFVWKALGYSITGITVEQIIFLLYGTGANGKSLLLKVLNRILGSYSYVAPFSVFDQRRGSQSNDLAALVGKRLVIASETRENTTLDEARIKLLTGGDPITARFLYHENFTFVPQLKPWLALNHLPRVTDQSHGFWRKIRLVPFDVRFEGPQDDKHLEEKLLSEKEGILVWLLKGALLYQKEGLDPPDIVLAATQEYQTRSDPLSQFIADCCVVGPGQKVGANRLYDRYKTWALYRGASREETLGGRSFGENMSLRFRKKREARGKYYDGIGLKKAKP